MRVCHIVPSLEDRHGGPSKSVRALANAQALLGDSVELLATGEGPLDNFSRPGEPAAIRVFPRVMPRWLSRSPELQTYLSTVGFDCVHSHALWLQPLHYARTAARRLQVPLVISPRGMLSNWAYRHRRWRKWLAELVIHPGAFAAAAGWHATSHEEAADIRRLGFNQPVCISPNGIYPPSDDDLTVARNFWQNLCPDTRGRPVALFYSRFHRKKRLKELIELWLAEPRGDWLLLVVGICEDYDAASLNAELAGRKATSRVAVFDGTGRPPPYAVASLFLLPSHSENFALVIAEALAAGVPALVTDTTPWQDLKTADCGWCVPWEQYSAALASALASPASVLAQMGERGRIWSAKEFSWQRVAGLLRDFYRQLRNDRR